MRITLNIAFHERGAVRLLNWLAGENARIMRQQPDLPLLYDSGVRYQREKGELWSDYINLLVQGHEDCDALAAARAGELLARGWKALRPGEPGYRRARLLRPRSIHAEVFLRTRTPRGVPGMYHCIVAYRIGTRWYEDDPSARLGMDDVPQPLPATRTRT